MNRACLGCGGDISAKRASAKVCSDRCRKRAQRHGLPRNRPEPFTRQEALANVRAMLELLPADLAVLEARHPLGADEAVDDVIGGLWTHLASLERLEAWLVGGAR